MSISSLSSFSRTARPSVSKTVGGVEPDWKNIPHANMTSLSKEEIKAQVRELAIQDANATSKQEKEQVAGKVQELFNQYASSASPDRKSLYENAVETIKKQAGGGNKKGSDITPPKTLFDYLNERDTKNGMKFDKTYSFSGGGAVTASQVSFGGAHFDITHDGESVLWINSDGSVTYTPTPAETQLTKEIANVYYNARESAKNTPQPQTHNNGIDITI